MYTESLQTLHKFRSRYKKSVDVYVVSIDATNFLQTLQKIRRYYWQTSVSTVDIGIYCRHCRHRSTRVKGNLSLFSLLVSSLLSLLSSSFSISSVLYIQIECQRLQQRRHVYQYTSMSTNLQISTSRHRNLRSVYRHYSRCRRHLQITVQCILDEHSVYKMVVDTVIASRHCSHPAVWLQTCTGRLISFRCDTWSIMWLAGWCGVEAIANGFSYVQYRQFTYI